MIEVASNGTQFFENANYCGCSGLLQSDLACAGDGIGPSRPHAVKFELRQFVNPFAL
jgi:hypothetical protein